MTREEGLEIVRKLTGVIAELDKHFTECAEIDGEFLFNVFLKDRLSRSRDFEILSEFANKYDILGVQANGARRVLVGLNISKCSRM